MCACLVHPAVSGHPCQINNGGCSHLCLLSPGGGYTCSCPTNSTWSADNQQCMSSCTASQVIRLLTNGTSTVYSLVPAHRPRPRPLSWVRCIYWGGTQSQSLTIRLTSISYEELVDVLFLFFHVKLWGVPGTTYFQMGMCCHIHYDSGILDMKTFKTVRKTHI